MDITSLSKETVIAIARFSQEQFMIWLQIVKSPVAVVSRLDLSSPDAVLPALRFALFVYGLLFVVALPGYVVFFRLKISNPTIVLADLVMTGLGFLLIGFLLHVSAKIIRGRGALGQSLLTGLYLIGLWPIVQLTDYLVLPSPWLRSIIAGETPPEPLPSDYMYAFLMLILLPAVGLFLVIKTVPVIRHIHSIGSFRATIAVLLGITLIFGAFNLILYPLLRELIKVGK